MTLHYEGDKTVVFNTQGIFNHTCRSRKCYGCTIYSWPESAQCALRAPCPIHSLSTTLLLYFWKKFTCNFFVAGGTNAITFQDSTAEVSFESGTIQINSGNTSCFTIVCQSYSSASYAVVSTPSVELQSAVSAFRRLSFRFSLLHTNSKK